MGQEGGDGAFAEIGKRDSSDVSLGGRCKLGTVNPCAPHLTKREQSFFASYMDDVLMGSHVVAKSTMWTLKRDGFVDVPRVIATGHTVVDGGGGGGESDCKDWCRSYFLSALLVMKRCWRERRYRLTSIERVRKKICKPYGTAGPACLPNHLFRCISREPEKTKDDEP